MAGLPRGTSSALWGLESLGLTRKLQNYAPSVGSVAKATSRQLGIAQDDASAKEHGLRIMVLVRVRKNPETAGTLHHLAEALWQTDTLALKAHRRFHLLIN